MANNPYVNKVEYAGQTVMDISNDTVTPSDVLDGVTFHDRSGAPQTGSVITHNVYDGLDSTSTSDALSANQGRALNSKITTNTYSGDLNSLGAGTWYCDYALNRNFPDGNHYFVTCIINGNYKEQIAYQNGAGESMWFRRYRNSWSAWQQLALKSDIDTLIKFEEISVSPDSAITAGTPGTRGAQKQVSYNKPTGYRIVGIEFIYIANSAYITPFAFTSNDVLYINWYRAVPDAIPIAQAIVSIRVTYAKGTFV